MNREQRREEKFAPLRGPKKPKAPELPPLRLPWMTPKWAKEDRYRMVKFENGDELVARPVRPGLAHPLWEMLYNNQIVMERPGVKATTEDLHTACLNLESVWEQKQK